MFGKFMNKKFFHPGSYPNIKQKWIHEQRAAAKSKLEQEKKDTYQKEQESYQSRMLSTKSSSDKMKLDLNFMYDLPPGMRKECDENQDEQNEVKFEWQKHAPRSKYINDLGLECQDQPFGVCVRNIRCFKCKQWGHQNTDRDCPLFFTDIKVEGDLNQKQKENLHLSDPMRLVEDMRRQHGITLKTKVIGQEIDPMAENQQLLESDDDADEIGEADLQYIESLSAKEKKKLLKIINKLEKKEKESSKKRKSLDRYDSPDSDYKHRKKRKKCDERQDENERDLSRHHRKHKSRGKEKRHIDTTDSTTSDRRIDSFKRERHNDRHRSSNRTSSSKRRKDSRSSYDTDNETNKQIAECRRKSKFKS